MSRYVEIPSDAFDDAFSAIAKKIIGAGGNARWVTAGNERVFEVILPAPSHGGFRVFTSTAVGSTVARECGKDAVRIVVGMWNGPDDFKPTAKARRLLRTAPALPDPSARVDAFIHRLVGALRDAWRSARQIKICDCGSAMAARKSKDGSAFLGCTSYPVCRNTRPIS